MSKVWCLDCNLYIAGKWCEYHCRKCEICEDFTYRNKLLFCVKHRGNYCQKHWTNMQGICAKCYEPSDESKYMHCEHCNNLNELTLMTENKYGYICNTCKRSCSSCHNVETSGINCESCKILRDKYGERDCKYCMEQATVQCVCGYYICGTCKCIACELYMCKICDRNVATNQCICCGKYICDGCDNRANRSLVVCGSCIATCQLCNRLSVTSEREGNQPATYKCRKCRDVYCPEHYFTEADACIKCAECDFCANSAKYEIEGVTACLDHIIIVNGNILTKSSADDESCNYCDESNGYKCPRCFQYCCETHHKCKSCKICGTIYNLHINGVLCTNCYPKHKKKYCQKCASRFPIGEKCVLFPNLCKSCHCCKLCYNVMDTRVPAIDTRIITFLAALKSRQIMRPPRFVLMMILRLTFHN